MRAEQFVLFGEYLSLYHDVSARNPIKPFRSYCGRPSVISNQGDFNSMKMCLSGVVPGSSSRRPAGISTSPERPRVLCCVGIASGFGTDEPHRRQNETR